MHFQQAPIKGLIEITPKIFFDERGFFLETYQQQLFADYGVPAKFVQDNRSFSKKGVIRGLHFQKEPFAQGKLVQVITYRVLYVVVYLCSESSTLG